MTSPQACLRTACCDDRGSLLCALELVACPRLQLAEVVGAVIDHRVSLEPSPQIFDWIEIGRIRRQEGNLYKPIQTVEVVAHVTTVVSSGTVPDHQQGLLEMGFERLQEVDQLLLLDTSLVQPEQTIGARQSSHDRNVRPVEVKLDDGRLSLGCPCTHTSKTILTCIAVLLNGIHLVKSFFKHWPQKIKARFNKAGKKTTHEAHIQMVAQRRMTMS